jgi:hypothetical protein
VAHEIVCKAGQQRVSRTILLTAWKLVRDSLVTFGIGSPPLPQRYRVGTSRSLQRCIVGSQIL